MKRPIIRMAELNAVVGGKEMPFKYKDCAKEMAMVNKAFIETMCIRLMNRFSTSGLIFPFQSAQPKNTSPGSKSESRMN